MTGPRDGWRSTTIPIGLLAIGGLVAITAAGPIRSMDLALPLLWAAGWLALLTLAAFGAGDLLVPVDRPSREIDLELLVLALSAGAGLLIAGAGVVGACHLFHAPVLIVMLALAACRGGLRAARIDWPRPPAITLPAFAALVVVVGAITLLAATAPSPFYDQWNYHLAFPFQWLRVGVTNVQPLHSYSFMPANAGLLFSYALAGPGPWAAQVTTWWCCGLAAMSAAALARRLTDHPTAPILAATLVIASPSVAEMATVAIADPLVMAFGGAAWLSALRLGSDVHTERNRAAIACGAFVGLAIGTKYLAALTVAIPIGATVALALAAVRRGNTSIRATFMPLIVVVAVAGAAFLPWATRNAAVTGAPLYPYFTGTHSDVTRVAADIGDLDLSFARMVAAMSVGSVGVTGFAGRVGPQFLWLVPLVIFDLGRRRSTHHGARGLWLAAGVIAGLVGFAVVPPLGRYLAPLLVPLAALAAAAWGEQLSSASTSGNAIAHAVLLAVLVGGLNPMRMAYVVPQLGVATGVETPDDLLRRDVSSWAAMEAANRLLPAGSHLLLVAESRSYGFECDVTVQDSFAQPLLDTVADASSSSQELLTRLRNLGITHVLVSLREMQRLAPEGNPTRYFQPHDSRSRAVLDHALGRLRPLWRDASCQLFAVPMPSPEGEKSTPP